MDSYHKYVYNIPVDTSNSSCWRMLDTHKVHITELVQPEIINSRSGSLKLILFKPSVALINCKTAATEDPLVNDCFLSSYLHYWDRYVVHTQYAKHCTCTSDVAFGVNPSPKAEKANRVAFQILLQKFL